MQRIYKILVVLGVVLALAACDNAPKGFTNISVEDAYAVLKTGDAQSFIFLDVRTKGEYVSGHVPSALHIPVQDLKERLAEVPKDKTIYVYCKSGGRSTKAANILVDAGYTNIVNMKASMDGWHRAGFPVAR